MPINTAAYAGLPREKSNNASALLNLSRNVGGSFGISLVTTMLARRSQYHQNVLIDRFSAYNPGYGSAVSGLGRRLAGAGSGLSHGMDQARGMFTSMLLRQASMLSYIDVFFVLAVSAAVMIPLVMMMKSNKPGAGGGAAH